jgi:hypothetical protein
MRFLEFLSAIALSLLSDPITNDPPNPSTDGQSYVAISDISISITTPVTINPSVP